jgi:uncharacterized alkaline shock family protein YloU
MTPEAPVPGGPAPQSTWSIDQDQIAEIARKEICDIPGVVGVSGSNLMDRISGHAGGSRAAIKGGQVNLAVSVIIEYGRPLPCMVDDIRQRAARAVEGMTGYRVGNVDITVADLHVPGEPIASREPGADDSAAAPGGARVDF